MVRPIMTGSSTLGAVPVALLLLILPPSLGVGAQGETTSDPELDRVEALIREARYQEAEELAKSALARAKEIHGPESIEVGRVLSFLAESLWRQGKTEGVRGLSEQAIAITEGHLGPDHPELARGLKGLADLLMQQGEHDEATTLNERALGILDRAGAAGDQRAASILSNLGILYGEKRDYAAARSAHERAVELWEKSLGPDHPDTATGLQNLGNLMSTVGDPASSIPLLERALAIRERALGVEHPFVAESLRNLAITLWKMGDTAAAGPLLERALAIQQKIHGADDPKTCGTLNALASVHYIAGDYDKAQELYERAMEILDAAGESGTPLVGRVLNNLANVMADRGDNRGAAAMYERALAISTKTLGPEHPWTAVAMVNLGSVRKDLGEYAAAGQLLRRAVELQEKVQGPEHPDLIISLDTLSSFLTRIGETKQAVAHAERALAIAEKTFGPENYQVAEQLHRLSLLRRRTGDLEGARALAERAVRIFEKSLGSRHPSAAKCVGHLGSVLDDLGEHAEALRLTKRALDLLEKVWGPRHSQVAKVNLHMAARLRALGEWERAQTHSERAASIWRETLGPEDPLVGTALLQHSQMMVAMGRAREAMDLALDAEGILREDARIMVGSLPESGALHYATGRLSGLNLILSIATQRHEEVPGATRAAWDALIRSRALALDQMAGRHRSVLEEDDPEIRRIAGELRSARERLACLVVRGPGQEDPDTYRTLLGSARREKTQLEQTLAGMSAAFLRERETARAGLTEVAASLPDGTALLAYVRYRHRDVADPGEKGGKESPVASYLAFVLEHGAEQPQLVRLGTAGEIEPLVKRWVAEVSHDPGADRDAEKAYRTAGSDLRRWTWDPVASALGDSETVFIVPDGALHLVDLATLPVGEEDYILERGPLIHYLSAERDLVRFAAGEAAEAGEGLLVMGGPDFDERSLFAALEPRGRPEEEAPVQVATLEPFRGRRSSCGTFQELEFDPLEAARREAREVVRLWKMSFPGGKTPQQEATLLTGEAATEGAFKEASAGMRVLHLATHGFFLGDRCASSAGSGRGVSLSTPDGETGPPVDMEESPLLLSGLALAGANHRHAAGPGEEDGILTAEEIASLDLRGVEWAVLSACQTGLGEILIGEGVLGLRRAFTAAGANTVIMSLWEIRDRPARAWMRALYRARLQHGMGTAEAVREASLEVLERRRRQGRGAHPYHWGAFVAAGDWR
jgi:tetratricopeptide (TPR) repeat protein/CHAT domain-containing protein